MRAFLCASALALAAASVPAVLTAQETTTSWTISADQRAMVTAWPTDRQASYNGWAPAWQEYFWSLTPNQQTGWWALTDEQRTQVYAMTPEQRVQAWTSIEAQLAGEPPRATPATPARPNPGMGMPATPATPAMPAENIQANPVGSSAAPVSRPDPVSAAEPVPPARPADPAYNAGPYKGALTPPPPSAMGKKYPVCTRKIQDSCRNPGGV